MSLPDLPFTVSSLGGTCGELAIVLPGGPCRGVEYLGDLAGLGDDRALVVLHPRGTPTTGGLSRGWWTDADAEALLADTDPAVRAAFPALAEDDADTDEGFREQFLRQAPASYAHGTARESAHARVAWMDRDSAHAWFRDVPADAAERVLGADLPPALVIGGDRDLLTGVAPVRAYADALGARLTMLEDCGHYPWIEQPDAFRASLGPWLRR